MLKFIKPKRKEKRRCRMKRAKNKERERTRRSVTLEQQPLPSLTYEWSINTDGQGYWPRIHARKANKTKKSWIDNARQRTRSIDPTECSLPSHCREREIKRDGLSSFTSHGVKCFLLFIYLWKITTVFHPRYNFVMTYTCLYSVPLTLDEKISFIAFTYIPRFSL